MSVATIDYRYSVADHVEFADDDLFPIGEAHHGHMELFLGESGRLFAYAVPDGSLQVVASTFAVGVEKLLLGYQSGS